MLTVKYITYKLRFKRLHGLRILNNIIFLQTDLTIIAKFIANLATTSAQLKDLLKKNETCLSAKVWRGLNRN